ncbi:MAG: TetR/AcrR family transcriptional regulator [Bacillota bacterium]|nr:TetR/AcrR family transcriptional regulator [Bacillota bacterium]
MNHSFKQLDINKQNQILEAALIEFSKSGYKKASTNNIVEKAGIGKGMLFHYFNNKKTLFDDLIEISLEFMKKEFIDQIDRSPADFIEKSKRVAKAKMNAMKKNKLVFEFLGNLYLHEYEGMDEDQINRALVLQKSMYDLLYNNVDLSVFREDIAPEMVMKLIKWSIDGFQAELVKSLEGTDLEYQDYKEDWNDFYAFLETLKILYYK